MNKILVLILAIGFSGSLFGADNRSAPNIFSSGSTISSSQMNENFNFLASKARVKTVNCDSGETIAGAINEGFNYLKISSMLPFLKLCNSDGNFLPNFNSCSLYN